MTFRMDPRAKLYLLLLANLMLLFHVGTGAEAAAWMQDAADYSTELRAVKHPYTRGIAAREGVEY